MCLSMCVNEFLPSTYYPVAKDLVRLYLVEKYCYFCLILNLVIDFFKNITHNTLNFDFIFLSVNTIFSKLQKKENNLLVCNFI